MPDNLLTIHQGTELSLLNTEQLDKLPVIDLHTSLLVEDAERIPSIIKNLSTEKLLAVVDLSSWDKDKFSPADFAIWLKVILTMEPKEALGEIMRLDHQELALFLSTVFDVKWYDPDQIYDGNPILTPDNVFLLFPKLEGTEEEGESELNRIADQVIDIAYLDGNLQFGRQLCIDTMNVAYSLNEEECYATKNARLADEGLPTYIEALELFYFEDPSKLLRKIIKMSGDAQHKKSSPDHDYIISSFTVVPKAYWDSIFNFSDQLLHDLQIELSALLTASIVVNNVVDKDSKHISEVIDRSKSYFNLGLELIRENISVSLEELLGYAKLRDIFRLGFSLLVDIKRNAGNLKAAVTALNRPDIIGPDEKEFLDHLLGTIPMFQKTIDAQPVAFEKLEQLKEARKMLSAIAERIVPKK
ncbi:MAG: DUF6178 family protein [bacterium]